MLEASDTPIPPILKLFSNRGVEVSFLVPTATGIKKSIMDAVSSVRNQLKSEKIHDFSTQLQGADNKRFIRAYFVDPDAFTETQASVYRPSTKQGDPRIWFYGLKHYAKPNNLLVLLAYRAAIYVVNASRDDILASLEDPSSPLFELLESKVKQQYRAANELLNRIRQVSSKGFIESAFTGDTAVGAMLLSELKIPVYNMNKGPDFRGIEIKAHRINARARKQINRGTLFSEVPNWRISHLSSGEKILREYGYLKDGRLQLYCTIKGRKPNPQGLFFSINTEGGTLDNLATTTKGQVPAEVVKWEFSKLKKRLVEKHSETFFVGARVELRKGKEYFHYSTVQHTKAPLVDNLELLIDQGIVTFDYTLSLNKNGHARDHGYLFKIHSRDLDLLLPMVKFYKFN